ncbi:hypothetical protein V1524DRAFT_460653 [Lipomyces starkeyi]
MERTRCMLGHAGLPKAFWGEAVITANYLRNISPLIIFIGPDQSKKLDTRANLAAFIGYAANKEAYRLYDLTKRNVLLSRNVVFDESKVYKDRFTVSDSGFSLDIVPDSDTQDDWTTREVSELGTMSEGERTVDSENSSHEGVTEHGDLDVSQCIPARAGVDTRSRLQESHRAETVAQNPDPEPTVTGSSVATS